MTGPGTGHGQETGRGTDQGPEADPCAGSGTGAAVASLASLLGDLGGDGNATAGPPTPREVADFIWLARQLPRTSGAAAAGGGMPVPARPAGEAPLPPDGGAAAGISPRQPDARARLYLPHQGAQGEAGVVRVRPVRLPGLAALPERRAVLRALRPLKRRVPDPWRTTFDEEATAEYVAEHLRWLPVLRPAADRWLSVALVLDTYSEGAVFWEPLAREVHTLLHQLGAFRDVRLHHLRARPDGSPGLAAGPRTPPHLLRPAAGTADPAHRTLTLLLTDGVAPEWQGGALRAVLRKWAAQGPTAIVQTLPEHAWGRTILAPAAVRFRSAEAGSPTASLAYTSYGLAATPPARHDVAVPVLAASSDWLGPWARLVAGATAMDGAAVILGAPGTGGPSASAEAAGGVAHSGRSVGFEEFRAAAQPQVFKLAAYLSVAPLNLPVMRAVQAAMLPGSPPADLAEIVFSGILEHVRTPHGHDAAHRAYDFVPGMRDRLLSTLRRDEAEEVVDAVSSHVERHAATGPRFTAAVADPDGPALLPADAAHWAELRQAVRRRQGRMPAAESPQAPLSVPVAAPAPEPRPAAAPAELEGVALPAMGRRFLITLSADTRWDGTSTAHAAAHQMAADARDFFLPLGYAAVDVRPRGPAAAVLESLDRWAREAAFRQDDVLVLYYAGPADTGERTSLGYRLSIAGGRTTADVLTTASVDAVLAGHGLRHVMHLLDGLIEPPDGEPEAVVSRPGPPDELISMHTLRATTKEEQWLAGFPGVAGTLKDEVLPLLLDETNFFSREEENVFNYVADRLGDRPHSNRSVVGHSHGSRGGPPVPFFANPVSPLNARAGLFADRTALVTALFDWLLGASDDRRTRVIKGSAASGKTTLVHRLAAGTRGTPPVHPTGLLVCGGVEQPPTMGVYAAVADYLGLSARQPREILDAIARRGMPLPIVVDADTAPGGERAIWELLRPLANHPMVRLVVVTAKNAGDGLARGGAVVIDLDSVPKDPAGARLTAPGEGALTRPMASVDKLVRAIGRSRTAVASRTDSPPHAAGMLVDLANRRAAAGDPVRGLADARDAAELYRTLSADGSAQYRDHLAYAEATVAVCARAIPATAPPAPDGAGEAPLPNPYHQVGRVVSGEDFVGRRPLVREIESLWRSPRAPASLAVIGHHRTGRTSLVRRSLSGLPRARPDVVPVWISLSVHETGRTVFRSLTNTTLAELASAGDESLGRLVEELRPLNDAAQRARTRSDLHDVVQRFFAVMYAAGRYVLLVLDEFDAAASVFEQYADFQFLRTLVSDAGSAMGLITISRGEVEEIEDRSPRMSPFSGVIARRLYVGMFSDAETDLVLARAGSAGVDLTGLRGGIVRRAGSHPFLLGVLCHALVEQHQTTGSLDLYAAYGKVNEIFLAEFERLMRDIADDSPESARVLVRMASGLPAGGDVARLRRMGIVYEGAGGRPRMFSESFARYVHSTRGR
ncbi:SAV_2336 N-terminal domain-related protein [Streptomyces sp. NPDC049040]|uniref:SAV_2336 N-terminal domain-related protein n=1 Tax=Streptomyces sp. NPDC049040 TaxID=3365593 RepID=UPI003719EF2F